MFDLTLHLRLAGLSMLALAFAHIPMTRYFHWREDAARMTPFNRQVFHVHCFFVCLAVAFMGALALVWPAALLAPSPLSRLVSVGIALFWLARLFVQIFIYDRAHWQGKRLETIAHILFSLLWLYYIAVFGAVWWQQ